MSVSFEYVFLKDDMPCKSEKCPLSIKANLQRFRRLVPVLIVIFSNLSLNIASKSLIQAHLLTLVERSYLFSQGTGARLVACNLTTILYTYHYMYHNSHKQCMDGVEGSDRK